MLFLIMCIYIDYSIFINKWVYTYEFGCQRIPQAPGRAASTLTHRAVSVAQ